MSRRNLQQAPSESDEAQEAHLSLSVHSQHSNPPSDQESGEDLEDNFENDYQPIPELDKYVDEGVDHQVYEPNPQARKEAEKELLLKDFNPEDGQPLEEYLEDESEEVLNKARRQFYGVQSDDEDEREWIDAEEQRGSFKNWILNDSVRRYIRRFLTAFILKFKQKGRTIYVDKLQQMCVNNEQSIEINYEDLREYKPILANWLARHPRQVLPEYSAAVYAVAVKKYPTYSTIIPECHFRILQISTNDTIRNLSYRLLGQLIKVEGVVTSMSICYNQLRKIYYKCTRCGTIKGPFFPADKVKIQLRNCFACHHPGPFIQAHSQSVYRNYRIINLQESPSNVAPGRIPRSKEAILFGDCVQKAKPGDEVEVIGCFSTRYDSKLNITQGFPIFHTLIEVNSITPKMGKLGCSKVDQMEFQKFSKEKNFAYRFYNSIAPSIYGHFKVKRIIALALFGGVQKFSGKHNHRIRGDINVLLMGDPGLAKSQILKSVQKIFPRCVYTTGKGATAVGLTAAVKMDKQTKEWKLEAGALVLADRGVCLIDEFDKMSEQDRTSIHEAMEQQTISISKAGIVATLNARCTVLAAANPVGGYYNQQISFSDNVELSQPILSRFDVLCVMKDRPSKQKDGKLASFVLNQHLSNHPYQNQYESEVELLKEEKKKAVFKKSQDFLKQYIKYARQEIKPKLSNKTSDMIQRFYIRIRDYSIQCGGLNLVVRHLQSMVRIAQAHARMFLRSETNDEDGRVAILTVLTSFIDTQRHSTAQKIKKDFKQELLQVE